MSKTRFIQQVIIRSLPRPERVEAGVRYAEQVYDELTRLGYGAPKQRKARDSVDYYNDLSGHQREWLDRFRSAYGIKYAPRSRTALAWSRLPEHSETHYRRIIDAAKIEASLRTTRETTAPYAELWLNERRYEDLNVSAQARGDAANRARKLELNSQLNALKQFNADGSNDDEIQRIEQEIARL